MRSPVPTPSKGNYAHHVQWDKIQAVYTVWEDLGDTDRPRTLEELELVMKHLTQYEWFSEPFYRTQPNGRFHQSRRQIKDKVRKWIRKPEIYYPWEDEVLVQRALDFYHDAWDESSVRDWVVIMNRLAAMRDPWEMQERWVGQTELSARMHRWYNDFQDHEREAILSVVERRRANLK